MANFKLAFGIVMGIEGGYANDKDDRGGETYKGISRNNFPDWKGWAIIDGHKNSPAGFEFMLETDIKLPYLVEQFYKTEFWDVLALDHVLHQKIAIELFDTGVNMGTGVAAVFIQDSLNVNNNNAKLYPDVKVDAKIGPVTVGYLNKHPRPEDILKTLNVMQGAKYIEICKRNPKQEKFYRGWLTRVELN